MGGKRSIALGGAWTLDDLYDLAFARARPELHPGAREKMDRARAAIERLEKGGDRAPNVYGVNTGFGALAETRIAANELRALQQNLIRSHACGVGPDLPLPVVRAMMALRAQTLALGCSGVRSLVVERIVEHLEADVIPRVPSQGSVGASGDLAPLAHLALALLGEGEVYFRGERQSAGDVLTRVSILPLILEAKEGLSLINGTQMMLAVGGIAVREAQWLCDEADMIGAMSLEALQGSVRPFDARVHRVRPHPGQEQTAANLRAYTQGSQIMESHKDCSKVQDPYSLRCMPQIHGATRDTLSWVRQTLEREIVSATDNPLVLENDTGGYDLVSAGNFHGQPVAVALDAAAVAVATLGNVSERRIEQLVNPALSSGLPPFLAPRTGLDSGFMIAQVTAAALVSENKVLCHPASADTIPSSAGKEDHVSMGSIASTKLAKIVQHVRTVLAVEALCAAQGLDLRKPLEPGTGVRVAKNVVREVVSELTHDRPLHIDIENMRAMLEAGVLRNRLSSERARGNH